MITACLAAGEGGGPIVTDAPGSPGSNEVHKVLSVGKRSESEKSQGKSVA